MIIADGEPAYTDLQHPGLLIANQAEEMARDVVKQVSAKAPHPVTATTETHRSIFFRDLNG